MSAERWQRLQELFEALVALPASQRADWLSMNESDGGLAEEALVLVANEELTTDPLALKLRAAANAASQQPAAGLQVGPYRLISEIGSGGMGTVFLAERVDADFDRKVAIKLIRGIPTADASRRMRTERQILAKLSHPHIAKLLDGGTTDAGQPYLVMEFIDAASAETQGVGEAKSAPTITDFCITNEIPRNSRLRLFQQVCRAVHYAHQRLIIHRDLKPGNVLVRADGTPVLLDFGIAKLLAEEKSGAQIQTGLPWFTPAYASPEQRRGSALSTATDIYALGILLHQLVAGAVPVANGDGSLPALKASRARHRSRVGDRDLEIIVAKATHAEADRRYASAEALSNDIGRHLKGRPLQAVPDSLGYRAGKFISRNRWSFGAAVLMLALASTLLTRLVIENERARQAEEIARNESQTSERVIQYLVSLFDAASPIKVGARSISPQELIDSGVREARLQLADEPRARARLLAALGEIYAKLGKSERSIGVLEEAVKIERASGDKMQLAHYLRLLGDSLNFSERNGPATATLREARELLQQSGQADPGSLADVLTTLSLAQSRTGRLAAAIDDADLALQLARQADGTPSLRVSEAYNALTEAHWRNGDLARAQEIGELNIASLEMLADTGDQLPIAKAYLAMVLVDSGERDRAEALLRDAIRERLLTLDSGSDWLIALRNQLGLLLHRDGRILEAIELLGENLVALRMRGDTQAPSYMIALNNFGSLQDQIGNLAVAEDSLREAVRLANRENDSSSALPDIYRQGLGRILMLRNKLSEALPLIEEEIVDDGSEERRIARLRRLIHLAEWNRRRGQLEAAMAFIRQAESNARVAFGPDHVRAAFVARGRALIERDQGNMTAAEQSMHRALELIRKGFDDDSNALIEILVELADIQGKLGNHEAARQTLLASRRGVGAKFSLHSATSALFNRLSAQLAIAPLVEADGTR